MDVPIAATDDGDLFSNDSSTKRPKQSNMVAKQQIEQDAEDGDLLGGGSAVAKTTVAKTTIVQETKKEADDLFGDSVRQSDDLFASSPPPVSSHVKQTNKPEKAKQLFGSSPEAKSDDDLFGPSPPTPLPAAKPSSRPALSEKVKQPPPVKQKKDALLDDEGSDDDLFSEPQTTKTPESPVDTPAQPAKKKPPGAVALFGGVDLFGTTGKKQTESHDKKEPALSQRVEKFGK